MIGGGNVSNRLQNLAIISVNADRCVFVVTPRHSFSFIPEACRAIAMCNVWATQRGAVDRGRQRFALFAGSVGSSAARPLTRTSR